ncbi:MAG: hypothetical protein IH623_09760 [Verrucomicrobia bacterium]|nr:hypothetical protein [Verrucomicrobiota bacterium]
MRFLVRPAFWLELDRQHYWLAKHLSDEVAERWLEAVCDTVLHLREYLEFGWLRHDDLTSQLNAGRS